MKDKAWLLNAIKFLISQKLIFSNFYAILRGNLEIEFSWKFYCHIFEIISLLLWTYPYDFRKKKTNMICLIVCLKYRASVLWWLHMHIRVNWNSCNSFHSWPWLLRQNFMLNLRPKIFFTFFLKKKIIEENSKNFIVWFSTEEQTCFFFHSSCCAS